MSKIYGYARCSLAEEKGQDLNRQVRELKAAGAEEIITEREHGDAKVKQNLDLLLEVVGESLLEPILDIDIRNFHCQGFSAHSLELSLILLSI